MRLTATPRTVALLLDMPGLALVARVLLTSPFWVSGLLKVFDFRSALQEATHFGLQPALLVAVAVILVQISGSLAVILNRGVWLAAWALAAFTLMASLIGHAFWTVSDPVARFHDMNAFVANIGLIGGLVLAAVIAGEDRRP